MDDSNQTKTKGWLIQMINKFDVDFDHDENKKKTLNP